MTTSTRPASAPRFVCLRVRARSEAAERALAEAAAAGASGVEERSGAEGDIELLVYAPVAHAIGVAAALEAAVGSKGTVAAAEPVPEQAWSEAWKEGLRALEISPRLLVRPPFVAARLRPGQQEVVIPPGQAFGTGAHVSTHLALEALDAALAEAPAASVLDVGTGSGVLALAALRLGTRRAVGLDLDPVAVGEAAANARAHGMADRLDLVVGPIAAVGGAPAELVVANLLKSELLPILGELAARVAPGGRAIVSGLLAPEADEVEATLGRVGLLPLRRIVRADPDGVAWVALTAQRPPAPASPRGGGAP